MVRGEYPVLFGKISTIQYQRQFIRGNHAIFTKHIHCFGAGYVGGPAMAAIALKCSRKKLSVMDINPYRMVQWDNDTH